jgi:hypothetical protein
MDMHTTGGKDRDGRLQTHQPPSRTKVRAVRGCEKWISRERIPYGV